ncbi:MAG: hypothetical protein LBD67_10585 [Candidatus Accumulibacter sp.]|nr:hypothetical protein [Accumulibacter sp.]
MEKPVRAKPAESSTAPISVCVDFSGTHRQPLSPFVLSLSKYERTLRFSSLTLQMVFQFVPFESFFNPYPSTGFLRQAQDGAGRTN